MPHTRVLIHMHTYDLLQATPLRASPKDGVKFEVARKLQKLSLQIRLMQQIL